MSSTRRPRVVIAAVLCWRLGITRRALWVLGTIAASVVLTTALTALAPGALSLFNLIATVLVAGLWLLVESDWLRDLVRRKLVVAVSEALGRDVVVERLD